MAVALGIWAVIYLVAGVYAKHSGCRGSYIAAAQLAKDIQSVMVLLCFITLFGIMVTIALRLWRCVIQRLCFNQARTGREK